MADAPQGPAERGDRRAGNARVVAVCLGLTFGMLGAAFASVPFYRWFCRATGYDGTPNVAEAGPGRIIERWFEVRLDANVFSGLPWTFAPEVPSVRLRAGEVATVVFRIENRSDVETRGSAAFNVTPSLAGGHFTKLACFCFTEQVLKPHEVVEAPVTFFVDPSIDTDKNLVGLAGLTLSYTFFPVAPTAPRETAAVPGTPPTRPQL